MRKQGPHPNGGNFRLPDLGGKRIGTFHERDATGNILDFPMVAQNPEVRTAAKYQPGYDGLRESGKKLPPGMAECANGSPFDRATRRSRVGTAEAGARGVFRLVLAHMLQHANPGFKTRFECKSRCTSTADAGLPHLHTRTPHAGSTKITTRITTKAPPHSHTHIRIEPIPATDDTMTDCIFLVDTSPALVLFLGRNEENSTQGFLQVALHTNTNKSPINK